LIVGDARFVEEHQHEHGETEKDEKAGERTHGGRGRQVGGFQTA
jgi:hypothetical protein